MSDGEWQMLYDITYMWNIRIIQMSLFTQEKQTSQTQKTKLQLPQGRVWEERINTLLLYIEQINNKDSLCAPGNYIQYLVTQNRKQSGKKYMYGGLPDG